VLCIIAPQQQGLAAGAGAEIAHHLAPARRQQLAQQLAALVLDFETTVQETRMFLQGRLALQAQPQGRVGHGCRGQAVARQRGQQVVPVGLDGVHAQVQGGRAVQGGHQVGQMVAGLGAQALMQPVRQIQAHRLGLIVQFRALQAAQPFQVVLVRQGLEFPQIAAAVARQPGQQQAARRRRRGQDLQAAQVAQHAVHRLGDEGPVAAAQLGIVAEKAGKLHIGRAIHFQDQSQGLDGGSQVQGRGLGRRLWGRRAWTLAGRPQGVLGFRF
jgi:hypothetical protein